LSLVTPSNTHRDAGFTIIEVLVALAVVSAMLASIGALVATSARGSRIIERHVELVETARAIVSALPQRDQLASGDGERAGHFWRVSVLPFAGGIDPDLPSPWMPQTVVVAVRSPTGANFQVATVRLQPRAKE